MKEEKSKYQIIINCIQILIILASISIIVIFRKNITASYIAVLLIFIANVIFCLRNIKKRILLFMFMGCFFIFLMGRQTLELIKTGKVVYIFSNEISMHIVTTLYISLISILIGFYIVEKYVKEYTEKNEKIIKIFKHRISKEEIKGSLQKYSKLLFEIGWIINIILVIEKAIYINTYSYLDFVKSFSSSIPYFISIFANFRTIAFFIFLATMPEKKKATKIIFLYLIETIMLLLIGDRGNCIINILLIIFYVVFRQLINKEEKWIKKSYAIIALTMLPFIFVGLSLFVYIREGIVLEKFSFIEQFERFFKSIGNSVNIIGYEKLYENNLPRNILYSFGDFIQYIKYNPITRIIFKINHAPYYTEEYAMSGMSFMHTISYLINPKAYLQGHGYGSSYVAELYADFKYIGVIFGNMFLGAYMAIFYKIYKKSYILTACLLLSYNIMFFIPRAAFDYIITYIFNLTAILGTIIIVAVSIADIIVHRNKEKLLNE